MDPKKDKYSSCTRKTRHRTYERACEELQRLKCGVDSEIRPTLSETNLLCALKVYKCEYCPCWHIGSDKTRRSQIHAFNDHKECIRNLIKKLTKKERRALGKFIAYRIRLGFLQKRETDLTCSKEDL